MKRIILLVTAALFCTSTSQADTIERDLSLSLGTIAGVFGEGQTLGNSDVFFDANPILFDVGDTLIVNILFDQRVRAYDFGDSTLERFTFHVEVAPGSPGFNGTGVSTIEPIGPDGDVWTSITLGWVAGGAGFGWPGQGINITSSQGSFAGLRWTTTLTSANEGTPMTLHVFSGVSMLADGIELLPLEPATLPKTDRLFITPANQNSAEGGDAQVLSFDSRTGRYEAVLAPSQGSDDYIYGLTFGPDGYLYASYFDWSDMDGRILRVGLDGDIQTFVGQGAIDGDWPTGIAFGPDGNLYVANLRPGNVLKFDGRTGARLGVFVSAIASPQDIAFGPDGHLYVSAGPSNSIIRFDGRTGAFLGYVVAPGSMGLAFGPDGDLYVASYPDGTVLRFDAATQSLVQTIRLPAGTNVSDVAFGPDAKLYARITTDGPNTVILRVDPDSGSTLGEFARLPANRLFSTGMLFLDTRCAGLGAVRGGASGCFTAPLTLTLKANRISGCKKVAGTILLTEPAPATGRTVLLSDTLASASVPTSVTVPAGSTSKSFLVNTSPVSATESGSVVASLGGVSAGQPLSVRPMGLISVKLNPATVVGGYPSTGTATLECAAGPGPVTVDLSTSNPAVAHPVATAVVVPQGLKSQTFTVATNPVLDTSNAMITGEASTTTKSRRLKVVPAAAVSPTRLGFGSVSVGQTSGALSTILRNNGVVPFAVTGISLTGTYASWFGQTNNCPANLAAGASCTISVQFAPQAALSKSAKLSIATSATSTPLSVSLSGTGI